MELPGYLTLQQRVQINSAVRNNTPILVTGKPGPTGKTTLVRLLRNEGVMIFEPHECVIIELNENLDQ
ncbi:hypothetical protein [Listeria rocourtiae]|uniref:hypothetical protein n=1 Tax=Listeria rocourtiae TaxID=647910 RepID=UPI003D2F60D7